MKKIILISVIFLAGCTNPMQGEFDNLKMNGGILDEAQSRIENDKILSDREKTDRINEIKLYREDYDYDSE